MSIILHGYSSDALDVPNGKEARALIDIIRGSQEAGTPLVIYYADIRSLYNEVKKATGVKLTYKTVPDNYQTSHGCIWQRQNRNQFQLTL